MSEEEEEEEEFAFVANLFLIIQLSLIPYNSRITTFFYFFLVIFVTNV